MPETPPVFVTSLARGGTTALLNALSDDPSFASMQYRDMPFVTAPFLWSRLSSRSRNVERQDRAHGDGIKIDLDSPEAFDEVFWMLGWPGKYRDDGIEPWTATDLDDGVTPMMTDAFRRVALVRGMARSAPPQSHVHYLSKNNVNIARIGLLKRMFPDCRVVIALRRPGQHALSLWRQDQRFLTIHAEQPFTRRYMRDIGHFEFGALHRPVRFDAFDPLAIDRSLPDYWLSYWITAFRHLSAQRDQCIFVTQDNLRQAPGKTMTNLFDAMMITPKKTDFSAAFHDFPDEVDKGRFAAPLLAQATSLYEELARLSV